jgi:nucleoside-diphosphate-sugar epimerase
VLITGGAGFLGHALVRELSRSTADPHAVICPREIRVFDPRSPEPLDGDPRLRWIAGDVRDRAALREACRGVDLVFHCAALVDWGRKPTTLLEAVNREGTENVIAACVDASVPALVHTSTLDVVFTGRPRERVDESQPVADRHVNDYCRTKAEAEGLAIRANGAVLADGGSLRTAVLRPASIFGERDPYHVPGLVQTAFAGFVLRLGDGSGRCQHVYVGNVAHAHCLAARALLDGTGAAGQAYFITDSEPENFFAFLEPILVALGYRYLPRALSLPRAPMHALGAGLEGIASLLRPVYRFAPLLTRFAVDFVCLEFTVSGEKLARELGYRPIYGKDEALARTIAHFRQHPPA